MIRSKQLSVMGLMAMALISSVSQAAHHRTHQTVRVRTDEPDLRSSSALVLDTTHQSVLYSRKADMAAPIASITKLVTVLVVADAGLPLDEPIRSPLKIASSARVPPPGCCWERRSPAAT